MTVPAYDPQVRNAVLFDFGGVLLPGPFEGFAAYEQRHGLPEHFLRRVNSTDPDANAWARLERGEIDAVEFDHRFAAESEALGHRVPGADVLAMLPGGDPHPEMLALIDRLRALGYQLAGLTNDITIRDGDVAGRRLAAGAHLVRTLMDVVVASSEVGVRKPERRFYEIACEMLGVSPEQCVFLDDLGINLKPAAAMGMATIKVITPAQAIEDLYRTLGLPA